METHGINWPKDIKPEEFLVHARNQLFIRAGSKEIWDALVRAEQWPRWYKNCKYVNVTGGGELMAGTEFVWKTFHIKITSKVMEYKEYESLGWTARGFGTVGYHGWKLFPQLAGTLVVTEEVQKSWGVFLLRPFVKSGLLYWHQKWLEGISQQIGNKT